MKFSWRSFKCTLFAAILVLIHPAVLASTASDTFITGQVKSKLLASNFQHVSVETNNGIVSLGGQINSETQAIEAVKIAESVANVVDVDPTFLKTPPSGQPLKDAYIAAKIQGVYAKHNLTSKDPTIPTENIQIEVKNGIVYLSGLVANDIQVKQSIKLAQSVKGVVKVESHLHTS